MTEHIDLYKQNGFGDWFDETIYIDLVANGTMWGDALILQALCESLKFEVCSISVTRSVNYNLVIGIVSLIGFAVYCFAPHRSRTEKRNLFPTGRAKEICLSNAPP